MGFLPKKLSPLLLSNSKIPKIWKHRLKFCFEKSRPVFPDFGNFVYYQVKVGIFFWVKTLINGLLCFMLLWSHWFSASLLLKDSPLVELCCWKIWKTYFESLYRKKLVLKVSMFDNFLNFCYKKFLIWCFNIDLSNFCVI